MTELQNYPIREQQLNHSKSIKIIQTDSAEDHDVRKVKYFLKKSTYKIVHIPSLEVCRHVPGHTQELEGSMGDVQG